jgi:hypothetical protein
MPRIARSRRLLAYLCALAVALALPLALLAPPQPVAAGNGPAVTLPLAASAPALDGLCGSEYDQTPGVPITQSGGFTTTARLLLTTTDLYVCVPSVDVTRAAELYLDLNNDNALDAGDFRVRLGFEGSDPVLRANGYLAGQQSFSGPAPAGIEGEAALPPGSEFNYDRELRVPRAALGGYQRRVGLLLLLPAATGEPPAWPPQGSAAKPDAWGAVVLLSPAPPTLAVDAVAVEPGQLFVLRGSNFAPGPVALSLVLPGQPDPGQPLPGSPTLVPTTTVADATFAFTLPLQIQLSSAQLAFRDGLVTLRACAVQFCAPDTSDQNAQIQLRVLPGLAAVPSDLRQRAQRFLEEARATEPGWANATLAPSAEPFFRPDIPGPAYYEFAVLATGASSPTARQSNAGGFIILSTGPHDYPIAHWDSQGPPLSAQLRAKATGPALTLYKLDTLYYAAEDDQGQRTAFVGQEPFKVTSLSPEVNLTGGVAWTPNPASSDTGAGQPLSGTLEASGVLTTPPGLRFEPWEGWGALKAGYKASYQPFLDALVREARADWEIERNIGTHGIALRRGESYVLRFIPGTTPSISGPGTALIQSAPEGTGALRITATDARPRESVPFTVTLPISGTTDSDTVRFVVIDGVRTIVDLPLVAGSGPGNAAAQRQPSPVTTRVHSAHGLPAAPRQAWSPWSTWSAGTSLDQPRYDQIPPRTGPNPNDCFSGCGATAWAMLFGWADRQAEPGRNPRWAGRTGIYRAGGGRTGVAVAPTTQDAGVEAMTMEIRRNIGSYCVRPFSDASPTNPWDMGNAWRYLDGRTGTRLSASWIDPIFGNKADDLKRSIVERGTPAVMGTGFFEHYPLAWRYREQSRRVCRLDIFGCIWWETEHNRQFYVNQGWGGEGNGWVGYKSWFVGEIFP